MKVTAVGESKERISSNSTYLVSFGIRRYSPLVQNMFEVMLWYTITLIIWGRAGLGYGLGSERNIRSKSTQAGRPVGDE
jgi:hypothetical protein